MNSYKSETQSMCQRAIPRDFAEFPRSSNLLTKDRFYQLPMFSGFTIHFAPILYLFQGRSYRNKT